jgi:hypothetical protein
MRGHLHSLERASAAGLVRRLWELSPVSESETDGNAGRLLVIACGMLAREILAIRRRGQLHHVDITCIPAQLHFEPEKLPGAMQRAIRKAKARGYKTILAGYGDCGTGGRLDAVLTAEGVQRISGPHCFAFYQGMDAFAAREADDVTSFYFTDFLVRNFRTFFVEPLGLDRHPELIDDYFGHYERIVYLAQTDDPELDHRARTAAAWLGLAYERRLTGYGDLEAAVRGAAGRS